MAEVVVCSFCYRFLWLEKENKLSEDDRIIMELHLKNSHCLKPYAIDP